MEWFNVPPLPTVLLECKRLLRPGGRIVVIGVPKACEQWSDCDPIYTRRMRTAAGFAIKCFDILLKGRSARLRISG